LNDTAGTLLVETAPGTGGKIFMRPDAKVAPQDIDGFIWQLHSKHPFAKLKVGIESEDLATPRPLPFLSMLTVVNTQERCCKLVVLFDYLGNRPRPIHQSALIRPL
jgi:hypothetical protein